MRNFLHSLFPHWIPSTQDKQLIDLGRAKEKVHAQIYKQQLVIARNRAKLAQLNRLEEEINLMQQDYSAVRNVSIED